MLVVTSWVAARRHQTFQAELTVMDKREGVSRVVAMGVMEKTRRTQIIVIAMHASDHLSLVKVCQELDHYFHMEKFQGKNKIPLRHALQIRSSDSLRPSSAALGFSGAVPSGFDSASGICSSSLMTKGLNS